MTISLVSSVQKTGSLNGGTSGAIDTTGASLEVIHTAVYYPGSDALSPSDSKGNTLTGLTVQTANSTVYSRLWYAANPTVGSGHTFTVAQSLCADTSLMAAFSGVITVSPLDAQNGNSGAGVADIQTGSIAPLTDGWLVFAGLCFLSSTPSINSGMSIIASADNNPGNSVAGAAAYVVQGTAGAINPTWDYTGSSDAAAVIASFKAVATASGLGALLSGRRSMLIGGGLAIA